MRYTRVVKMLTLVAWLLTCVWVTPISAQTLRIYHIDVEQADATLFVSPSGRTMLFDSGKNGHGNRIEAVMNAAGVTQIGIFVNTHYHEDHCGGIDDLVDDLGVPVLESYDRGDKEFLSTERTSGTTYRDYQAAVGEDAIHLTRSMTIPFDPQVAVTCISSGGVVIGEENPVTGTDENDMSISLLITYGQFRYFIGGDIERATESKIAERDLVTDVDVHQANHHGSTSSSSLPFMEDLNPTVIIISNGNHGGYRHPRQATLDLYATLPGPPVVYQTNRYLKGGAGGNVPDNHIGDPETVDQDGTILVTVDNANGTYAVSYGAGSVHTYQIRGAAAATVVIQSLLPNPVGRDTDLEEVTLRNPGNSAISVAGWTLRDRSGRTWNLTPLGTLAAGQSRTIQRSGQAMSLNNAGDEISLIDAGNVVRDQFAYASSTEGVAITTGH